MWFQCFWGSSRQSGWFCQVEQWRGAALVGGHLLSYSTQHAAWFIWGSQVHACGNIIYLIVRVFIGTVTNSRSLTESTAGWHKDLSLTDLQEFPREQCCEAHLIFRPALWLSVSLCPCFRLFVEMKPLCQTISSTLRQSGNGYSLCTGHQIYR